MTYPDMGVILEVYPHMGTFPNLFSFSGYVQVVGGGEVTSKVSTWICGLGFQKPSDLMSERSNVTFEDINKIPPPQKKNCGACQKQYKHKMVLGYATKPRPNVRVSVQ